ncbi:MAG: GatB/YqeY domain-containing protein [Proteobacteria bacterium]|nr:GatB/YqeY domain-containing protein [Pseudomonadota bacterium]MCP4920255.1 GatB/YqeY domain-containing protein [Pseudomonadota bacterium]
MSIADRITADMKTAMRAKDKERLQAIRMIRAGIIEAAKAGKGDVTDDDVLKLLRKLSKQRKDAAETYVTGGRQDLADIELAELDVINEYLPKLADEAQTLVWVDEAIAASGATAPNHLGKAMGALMKAHKADIDGGLARKLLQQQLSG